MLCADDRFARSGDCTALSADCAAHSTDSGAIGRLRNDRSITQPSVDCAVVDDCNGLMTEG